MDDTSPHPDASSPAVVPAPELASEPASGPGPQTTPDDLAQLWEPLKVGEPTVALEPAPPSGLSYRPDVVCDGWSTPALHVRLASVRGYQHRFDGRPREDDAAVACDTNSGTVAFAVADGVSDAQQPHIGSQLASRSAIDEMLSQVRGDGAGYVENWDRLLYMVHWQLVEQTRRILRHPKAGLQETAGLLATTLVAGTATPTDSGVFVHVISVGDSGAWQIKHENVHRLVGGKPDGADGLVSSAVEPLPYLPNVIRPLTFSLEQGTVLLVGTDGFGDPLGDGTGAVARLFRDRLRRPVPPLGFAHLLDFSRETFDDDRTLIALWPRDKAGGRS